MRNKNKLRTAESHKPETFQYILFIDAAELKN